jgi:oligopeptide/dipeptide ABC transporter ATP-binding protein
MVIKDLLKVTDLRVQYIESGLRSIRALNGVSFDLHQAEAVAILGESGCGKSTLVKTLMRLLPNSALVTGGQVEFEKQNLLALNEQSLGKVRGARLAMVPQEPGAALNPVIKVGDQIAEVLRAHRNSDWKDCQRESERLLERVGLSDANRKTYDAYPHQLSGGQQQRVVIAQAVACEPALVIADEPTASLDPRSELEVFEVFRDLKSKTKLSLLLVTHDPTILAGLAERVLVMYAGRIVEAGAVGEVFRNPKHPYTQALLRCAPSLTPAARGIGHARLPEIDGSAPDPESLPAGCSFAPRCTQRLSECALGPPAAKLLDQTRSVECFLYGH